MKNKAKPSPKAQKPGAQAAAVLKDEVIVLLPHAKVLVSDLNTRQPTEAEVKASGLVQSIKELGQDSPCIVRPHPTKKGFYELAAGARRKTAQAVLDQPVPCIIREIPDDKFEDIIFADNFQRADPDPIAEAQLVARRLGEGADEKTLAQRYGQTVLWVQRRAKLAQLDPAIAKLWRKPESDIGHWDVEMMEHLALFSPERQAELVKNWNVARCANVKSLRRETETKVCKLDVNWLDDPATFVEGCGPGCATDSAKEKNLFGFADKKECSHCLNPKCFKLRSGLAADAAASRVVSKTDHASGDLKAAFYTGYKDYGDPTLLGSIGVTAGGEMTTFNVVRDHELQGYEIVRLKAKEQPKKGAVLALDVTKPDKPVIVVLKPKKGSVQAKKLAVAKKKASDPEAAQADKIAAFQARRWMKVRAKLLDELAKDDVKVVMDLNATKWVALAAWFGTCSNEDYPSDSDPKDGVWGPPWMPSTATPAEELDSVTGKLWEEIRPVLHSRLFHIQKVEDFTKPHIMLELREISRLIGFDLDAAKREVDLTELPIPKGWGKGIDPHTCLPVGGVEQGAGSIEKENTAWDNPKTLQQARKALSLDTTTVLTTITKFKDDRTYLMALFHCEKIGKNRKAVMKAISDARDAPYGKEALPAKQPETNIDDEE